MEEDERKGFWKKVLKVVGIGTIAAGAFAILKPPATTIIRKTISDFIPGDPKPGTVLYRDLFTGYAEHSGIYVGGGERCIVELQRDEKTRHSIIRLVSPEEFVEHGVGMTGTIFVSARDGDAVGSQEVANVARSVLNEDLDSYSLIVNNCHMFAFSCLKAAESHEKFSVAKMQELTSSHWLHQEMTLDNLRNTARDVLGADSWLKWNWDGKAVPERVSRPEPA